MTLTRPAAIRYPFAAEAAGGYINAVPDAPTGSALASWRQGFPPLTMTPLAGGGSPPFGADFNGVLNTLSANIQWLNAGGAAVFDSAFSAAVGGYPANSVLVLNDGHTRVISTTNGNTNDPNAGIGGATGWALFEVAVPYAIDTGVANACVVALTPALTTYRNGQLVLFKVGNSNTGPTTLDAGAGAAYILKNGLYTIGTGLVAGDITWNQIHLVVYDASLLSWVLLTPPNSQTYGQYFSGTMNPGLTNSSATPKMGGIGSAPSAGMNCLITPRRTGKVLANVSATLSNSTAGASSIAQIMRGTGAPPSPNSASTGMPVGGSVTITSATANAVGTVTMTAIIDMTINTQYWVDLEYATGGSGTSSLGVVSVTLAEL